MVRISNLRRKLPTVAFSRRALHYGRQVAKADGDPLVTITSCYAWQAGFLLSS